MIGYLLLLWVAISFFLLGLWIVYLETARWRRRRSARERPAAPQEPSFMRREMLP